MNKEIDALVAKVDESLTNWDGKTPLYAITRAALMEARALGLEEAAKVCEALEPSDDSVADDLSHELATYDCAAAIRALKGE